MNEEKWLKNPESVKQVALGMLSYTSGSILGPLVLFGAIGFFLDKYFGTKPMLLIAGILLAFVVTNVLIFKKVFRMMKKLDEMVPEKEEKVEKQENK